jgi:hypothetical protein
MPNSERVALVLTEAVVGTQIWDGCTGTCRTMPDEEWERTKLAAVGVLELVARAIDWPRLLADAEARHWAVHRDTCPDKGGAWRPITRDVCGECLHEALLAHGYPGHSQDWRAEPVVERRAGHVDWPSVFAQAVQYRRPEYVEHLAERLRIIERRKETADAHDDASAGGRRR